MTRQTVKEIINDNQKLKNIVFSTDFLERVIFDENKPLDHKDNLEQGLPVYRFLFSKIPKMIETYPAKQFNSYLWFGSVPIPIYVRENDDFFSKDYVTNRIKFPFDKLREEFSYEENPFKYSRIEKGLEELDNSEEIQVWNKNRELKKQGKTREIILFLNALGYPKSTYETLSLIIFLKDIVSEALKNGYFNDEKDIKTLCDCIKRSYKNKTSNKIPAQGIYPQDDEENWKKIVRDCVNSVILDQLPSAPTERTSFSKEPIKSKKNSTSLKRKKPASLKRKKIIFS